MDIQDILTMLQELVFDDNSYVESEQDSEPEYDLEYVLQHID